jgi:carnitine O-acetyltransferase
MDALAVKMGIESPVPDHAMTQGITFANQDKLQKLPIPQLEDSCRYYLEALEPLQVSIEANGSGVGQN